MNLMDFVIVILSTIDLSVGNNSQFSAFRVLRVLRWVMSEKLLIYGCCPRPSSTISSFLCFTCVNLRLCSRRIVKLVRVMTSMQRMLRIIVRSLYSLYNIVFLLLLFCFIYR